MLDRVWWHDPQKLIYSQFSGTISLQDLKQMIELASSMMETEGSEIGVDLIIDVSRFERYDRDFMNLGAVRALTQVHPKTRWIIVIDPLPNPIARFVGLTTIKLLRLRYAIAKSEPEAMAFIQHITPIPSYDSIKPPEL